MSAFEDVTVTLPRDFAGVLMAADGVAYMMCDSSSTTPDMSPVLRRVMVARLRAWADLIEQDELFAAMRQESAS